MLRDIIEAALWLTIATAYAVSEYTRHRRQTRRFSQSGRRPPPYQW